MGTRRITEFLARCLIVSAALFFPAGSHPLTALTGQQFNGLPLSVPSFVYYRNPQPQLPQNILFSPINIPYTQYINNRNLRDNIQTPLYPRPTPKVVINSGFAPQKHSTYEIRENNEFETLGNNAFVLPPLYRNLIPATNNPGFVQYRNNGFETASSYNLAQSNGFPQPIRQPNSTPSLQVSLLRYANSFPQPANQENELQKALVSLNPTFQQRQRSVATAGELVYRQQKAGAKPFLSFNSEGVQREGGEELSSPGGFLGQSYKGPTFVSAVGTPVSGVGQNPLYTGDSVQASKLDEASDVKGVKSPGGIPSPGRHPVSQDIHFARPFNRYANSFGYSLREDPQLSSFASSQPLGRGPFVLPSEAYRRDVINR